MELLLLGTAGPSGLPERFCGCARCAMALAAGEVRGPTSVLLDGKLVIDPGPDPAQSAARAGRDLTGLTHVLASRAAPAAPPEWLAVPASPVQDLITPAAPPTTIGGPPGSDTWHDRWWVVRPGDRISLGEYDVRVLGLVNRARDTDTAVGFDVQGGGRRLLYGAAGHTLARASLDALAGAAFDVVLLDVAAYAAQLSELRRVGAVTPDSDLVAVHLTHADPPPDELDRTLASWGVRAGTDGGAAGEQPSAAPGGSARRTLVLGGSRSGKSTEAERRMVGEVEVTYVATGPRGADDPEWAARVAEHRARRPAGWRTLESTDLVAAIRGASGPLLIDSLTLWLAAVMDEAGAWDDDGWAAGAPQKETAARLTELVEAWQATKVRLVAVSDEVGSGLVPPTAAGRRYRDLLGQLNAAIAAECEEVVLAVAGLTIPLRAVNRDLHVDGPL